MKTALSYLALTTVIVGVFNFLWFFAEAAALGGDALNGYQRGGHYFVASHGTYTEVSQAAWEWSRVHALSVFVTHPLAMAGLAYLPFRDLFPNLMAGSAGRGLAVARAHLVRQSGLEVASTRCAGTVGGVRFAGPLLGVSVFPGGILIKPVLLDPCVILASEVRRVTVQRRFIDQRLEIEHAGVGSISPVTLSVPAGSAVTMAIRNLEASPASAAEVAVPPEQTGHQGQPHGAMTVLSVSGLLVNVGLVVTGALWAIPMFGTVGFIWTILATVAAVVNLRSFLLQGRR